MSDGHMQLPITFVYFTPQYVCFSRCNYIMIIIIIITLLLELLVIIVNYDLFI